MGRVEIKDELKNLLKDAKIEIAKFNRKTYEERFVALYNKHAYILDAIEELYNNENGSLELLEDLATTFAEYAYEDMESMKKRNRQIAMIDYNMSIVSFVFPVLEKPRKQILSVFADKCVLAWNIKFPNSKIEKSTQEIIDGGFKNKLCYITTAVCDNLNKPDNCYELNLLRDYRDNYLMNDMEDGNELVELYYDIAPTIVKRINKEEDSQLIYNEIWDTYLESCILSIEDGRYKETRETYSKMVKELADKYLYIA